MDVRDPKQLACTSSGVPSTHYTSTSSNKVTCGAVCLLFTIALEIAFRIGVIFSRVSDSGVSETSTGAKLVLVLVLHLQPEPLSLA